MVDQEAVDIARAHAFVIIAKQVAVIRLLRQDEEAPANHDS